MSTTDPGMEDALKKADQDVEANPDKAVEEEEEQEDDEFRNPSRWWFASTACPLLAGTLGPMASGFNICALVYQWRVYIPPEGTEEHGQRIKDPSWLVAVNAISLACALAANCSLLLNMARRLKFSIAQPITIAGFLAASIFLIADMAALSASPTYYLKGEAAPDARHALTAAFYYAIFAAALYMIIGMLSCLTVYGAVKGYYEKDFRLTTSQRTLMLQTMSFIAYLLLGALVFSKVEGWEYLDAVYWADVTLLTVGLGDFSPATDVGRGLLFPFAIGGILMVGLVVGSIRSLVLERGKEKMSARIVEKKRSSAIHNVDDRKQTIRISVWAKADFSTDPSLSPAQRREEEFKVMRKLQDVAERERRWFGLAVSGSVALALWFGGAAIFMAAEKNQEWTYFESLYFTYYCLLTIGYGDLRPLSNSGKAFFVIWSLLAVPSLTILISNMGDTIIKWFSDLTNWVASITVLPGEQGFRATGKALLSTILQTLHASKFSPPGIFGDIPEGQTMHHEIRMNSSDHETKMLDRLAERLSYHIEDADVGKAQPSESRADTVQRDMHFYHYVLARECRNLQKDLSASPPKHYDWIDWEYYLKLMGNQDDPVDYPGQVHPDILVPDNLRALPSMESAETMTDGAVDRETELREWREEHEKHKKLLSHPKKHQKRRLTTMDLQDWSWLSSKSPLMATKSEAEWILDRLSAALERELNRQRRGYKREPPISVRDVQREESKREKRAGSTEGAKINELDIAQKA